MFDDNTRKVKMQEPEIWKFAGKQKLKRYVAESYLRLGEKQTMEHIRNIGLRMQVCGDFLGFAKVDGINKLVEANFCKGRLCPMCQWRRSLKIHCATSQIMDWIETHSEAFKALFLTLTVQNCKGEDLKATLDGMTEAWNRMICNKAWKRRVLGSMRTTEVTYNAETNEYHPHYHVLLLVPKSYGTKGDKLYWDQPRWVKAWRKAMRLDYDPVVGIQRIKKSQRRESILEVSKYVTKSTDYIAESDVSRRDEIVEILHFALMGRSLVSYAGIMRQAQKALKIEDPETGDLTDTIRGDVASVVRRFHWFAGVGKYIEFVFTCEKERVIHGA